MGTLGGLIPAGCRSLSLVPALHQLPGAGAEAALRAVGMVSMWSAGPRVTAAVPQSCGVNFQAAATALPAAGTRTAVCPLKPSCWRPVLRAVRSRVTGSPSTMCHGSIAALTRSELQPRASTSWREGRRHKLLGPGLGQLPACAVGRGTCPVWSQRWAQICSALCPLLGAQAGSWCTCVVASLGSKQAAPVGCQHLPCHLALWGNYQVPDAGGTLRQRASQLPGQHSTRARRDGLPSQSR